MKSNELKSLIKEAVKEVFSEEIKDIILEVLKLDKISISVEGSESHKPSLFPDDKIALYKQMLQKTHESFTTKDIQRFNPPLGVDSINGSLPEGEVGMDQIFNFIKHK